MLSARSGHSRGSSGSASFPEPTFEQSVLPGGPVPKLRGVASARLKNRLAFAVFPAAGASALAPDGTH